MKEDTYGQGWPEGNEVALKNTNASGQNHVVCFVDATILCFHRDAVSRML